LKKIFANNKTIKTLKNNTIELLSPAKNLEFGKIAVNFGADAIYIGAPRFGARASASNSIQTIENLCSYAHKFHSKVYVALNTILYEKELEDAQKMIHQIYNAGADALIIQDFGILEMDLPPISLHASTQTHNIQLEKIDFLQNVGFQRVVLARELTIEQIKNIKQKTNVELEVFIHGSLCVSYSGQCYLSKHIGGRSGNRGECAQPCRLTYDLLDSNEKIIDKNKHFLSLKDMKRADYLESMIDAGVNSFKIEGRMKDEIYLKNITAFYRKKIDQILENKTNIKTTSLGKFFFDFEPEAEKTFNRGFSDYFLNGRKENIHSLFTPKSTGKQLGKVTFVGKNFFLIETNEQINNGDGLCFFNDNQELIGLRADITENNKIFANIIFDLKKDTIIYRNLDHELIKKLTKIENCRQIPIYLIFSEIENGFALTAQTEKNEYFVTNEISIEKQHAKNQELATENIKNQLSKSGGTIFNILNINISLSDFYFIPNSILNELRRTTLNKLFEMLGENYTRKSIKFEQNDYPYFEKQLDYKANISNSLSQKFYIRHQIETFEPAFEISNSDTKKELMITKMCIKYNLGYCEKYQNPKIKITPKFLKTSDKKFLLEFDCKNCVMKVIG
jgi:putative protease